MSRPREAIRAAIAALTVDEIEIRDIRGGLIAANDAVPVLQRSIGHDLVRIERCLSPSGPTLLSATAAAIDEALLELVEALAELERAE